MLEDVGGELGAAIGREGLRCTVVFPNVSVEGLSGLFRFHGYSGDYMPHLSETVNEDEDVLIGDSHIGARRKGTYIVHRDVTPTALRYRRGS